MLSGGCSQRPATGQRTIKLPSGSSRTGWFVQRKSRSALKKIRLLLTPDGGRPKQQQGQRLPITTTDRPSIIKKSTSRQIKGEPRLPFVLSGVLGMQRILSASAPARDGASKAQASLPAGLAQSRAGALPPLPPTTCVYSGLLPFNSSMLISRIRNFWILPVTVMGNSSTNLKWRGILKWAMWRLHQVCSSSSLAQ